MVGKALMMVTQLTNLFCSAMIVGFSVSAARAIESLAAKNDVRIFLGSIIYRLMEEVKERVIDLLPVIIETKITGEANVLQVFDIQAKGKQITKVAGCRVSNGMMERSKKARLVRDGKVLYEGTVAVKMRYHTKLIVRLQAPSTLCGC